MVVETNLTDNRKMTDLELSDRQLESEYSPLQVSVEKHYYKNNPATLVSDDNFFFKLKSHLISYCINRTLDLVQWAFVDCFSLIMCILYSSLSNVVSELTFSFLYSLK